MHRRKHYFPSLPPAVTIRSDLKPGKVWVRKCDGKEFILTDALEGGLRFESFDSLFSHEHFQPKR